MAKRRMGIMLFLFCLCLTLLPIGVRATSTADAVEPIAIHQDCELTILYSYEGAGFADVPVELYKIADVSADFQYSLAAPFAESGISLNGIQFQSEWNAVRGTLASYILAKSVGPTSTTVTDLNGQASFTSLKPGMYLVSAVYAQQDDLACAFDSALVALPGLGTDGCWQYQVALNCKPEWIPPIEGDEEFQWKVLKLWKGDNSKDRPQSITVEIYCDGELFETVILSEENDWSYSWSAKNDGTYWMVAEQDVPLGYTGAVEERNNTFILTNTWTPDHPNNERPQTGDPSHMLLYLLMLCASGSLLILLGVAGKRKRL